MVLRIVLIVLCLLISGAADGIRDTLMFHYHETGFKDDDMFWNPDISWKNKWKNGDKSQGEAFPGSSTVFVWATDGWHLFQTVMLSMWRIAILIALSFHFKAKWWQWVLAFFVVSGIWSLGFHIMYSWVW